MAIVFSTIPPVRKWLTSDNNLVFLFNDDTARTPIYCDVVVNVLDSTRVYPSPDNDFYFNIKEYVSSQLDVPLDDLDLSQANPGNENSHILDWSRIYIEANVSFTMSFSNNETENTTIPLQVILGYEQPYDFHRGLTIRNKNYALLTPFSESQPKTQYIRVWKGLPFDIGVSNSVQLLGDDEDADDFVIENLSDNTQSSVLFLDDSVSRIIIEDGTGDSYSSFVTINSGINNMLIGLEQIQLNYIEEVCDGLYVKWLNNYGCYNYWLFEASSQELASSSRGVLNNDFKNIEDTQSVVKSLGRNSQRNITGSYSGLSLLDISVLESLTQSQNIMVYTGAVNAKPSGVEWFSVELKNITIVSRDFKSRNPEGSITFVFPEDNNIAL